MNTLPATHQRHEPRLHVRSRPLTSAEQEATYAHTGHACAQHRHAVRRKHRVHIFPVLPNADPRRLRSGVVVDAVVACHRDLHARRGREARVLRVPAALDREGRARSADEG
jgi:hypothetical protein